MSFNSGTFDDVVQRAIKAEVPTSFLALVQNKSILLGSGLTADVAATEIVLPQVLDYDWNSLVAAVQVRATMSSGSVGTKIQVWGPTANNNSFPHITLTSMVASTAIVDSAIVPVSPIGSIWYSAQRIAAETYTIRLVVTGLFISNNKRG